MSIPLPVLNRPLDNTALSTFMRCPREFKLSMIDGWKTKTPNTALAFGSLWHSMLEAYYKSNGDHGAVISTHSKLHTLVKAAPDEYRTHQRALVEFMRYVKKWPAAKDLPQTIGYGTDSPAVELSTAIYIDSFGHEYAVKIDRLKLLGDVGYVQDHKSTSRLDKHYFSQFALSNQMMGYTFIANKVHPEIHFAGVEINLLHVLKNDSNFDRSLITYTPSLLAEWEENTAQLFDLIFTAVRNNRFPAYFGEGCNRKYGKCQFFSVCSSSPIIRQDVLEQEFTINPWDPMANDDLNE